MSDHYYRDHAEAYDAISIGVPGDVEFYRDLAVESGGPVVELGVGTGRIAIPIARADINITGIDLEPAMLEVARRKAVGAGVASRLRLMAGDMRHFEVDEPVSLVMIPYRTFLHNLDTADQIATLEACHRALRPGGRLALNIFNPAIRSIATASGLSPEEWQPRDKRAARGPAEVVRSRLRVRDLDGQWRDTMLALRYVYCNEMAQLLARTGFFVESLAGDFAGTPFEETAPEMVWMARRCA